MILNNTPQNEAILSNVVQINTFAIKATAKSFHILSSGLYANKIKAIIRELSCNAVDSHIAAGKLDVPFAVHLPNSIEPWFSVRDYGVGLNHDQVRNIYTTYFESTKADSNDYIGALGLGSKSPFSYTDNFTVTAIKDGRKGIYSAFINDGGVPSIALMIEENTDELNGVEVKFAVENSSDIYRFKEEAASVYRYFSLMPIVTGVSEFHIPEIEYETKDIIPGVHVLENKYNRNRESYAIMGNIAYPIDVPNPETTLEGVHNILECGLVINFNIGELDFQASREGLSYIPQTIEAIKNKLIKVRDQLYIHIRKEAKEITNEWKLAEYLTNKLSNKLWKEAAEEYVVKNSVKTVDITRFSKYARFNLGVGELAKKYNIDLKGFMRQRGHSSVSNLKAEWSAPVSGADLYSHYPIDVSPETFFVINDTKIGALERAKNYFRQRHQTEYSVEVYVLNKVDSSKEMDTKAFFKAIRNPPSDQIFKVSNFPAKERKSSSVGANVSILTLESRSLSFYSRNEYHTVWVSAGKLDSFDDSETVYYVPLSGFKMLSKYGIEDAKTLQRWLYESGVDKFKDIKIYGVRKNDLDAVKIKSNWVNVEDYLKKTIEADDPVLVKHAALKKASIQKSFIFKKALDFIDPKSPYALFVKEFNKNENMKIETRALEKLYATYGDIAKFDFNKEVELETVRLKEIVNRYVILKHVNWLPDDSLAADYIKMVDTVKGI